MLTYQRLGVSLYTFWHLLLLISSKFTVVNSLGCSDVDSAGHLDIPAGTVSIGDDAFRDCVSLETVSIPDSVTSIGGGLSVH